MRVLQIGRDDWSMSFRVPHGVEWAFVDVDDEFGFDPLLIGRVDVTIVDAVCELSKLQAIDSALAPYTVIVARSLRAEFGTEYERFFTQKMAVYDALDDRQAIVDRLPRQFFAKPFGQKLELRKVLISPFHTADAWYDGSAYLATTIGHDGDFRQLVAWKENILYENQRALEIWPEFVTDSGVELELVVQLIRSGSSDVIADQRTYSQAELAEPIVFEHASSGYLSCSIFARGHGLVKVGPIHYRHSRLGAGQFIPGGKRLVDSRREELFYYFHPGDLKPPLNIYFAGYRPAEGFEGFFMMAGLGHPFLLFSDPRLEGGRFYLGSDELEGQVRQVIRELIDSLGFREEDVIFSGLSMGSFGALYYGSQFNAQAIIAGKPIIDLGYVAERGRLVRPRDFLTVFDMVNFWDRTDGDGNRISVDSFTQGLIDRWNGEPGFGDTKILMSYMMQDDYDDQAYYTLLNSQTGKPTTVIARGYQGRHNDDSASIVTWFLNQYRRVIDEYVESR
ncbi:accessory Sec system protein Asp2 [Gryllotalpicola protaetiae]|uniref:Accessory Sec system protein Asp2 n=1 Tax=Gryllotalpicola protaetiae TaxID=2419771 RepID=A0A387BR56_9MICO|nr:accessory Sec system protein Asp2 [Gryllotalpicola protaetiae]AYG05168.1 accessory Sec system protein Asp2 [Gryllotalpicola protaetiae]